MTYVSNNRRTNPTVIYSFFLPFFSPNITLMFFICLFVSHSLSYKGIFADDNVMDVLNSTTV